MNALSPSHIKELLSGKPYAEEFINEYWIPRRHCSLPGDMRGEVVLTHCWSREEAERDAIDCHDYPSFQYTGTIWKFKLTPDQKEWSYKELDFDPGSEQDRRAREEASEQRWVEAETLNYQRGV